MRVFQLSLLILCLLSGQSALAAEPGPVAQWGFGQEESTPLRPHGGVHRDIPGPRPPEYPDFLPDNSAVKLDGNGARFTFADPGVNSPFDFTNGDEITLEAWVQIRELHSGENVYVIGKGRTGNPKFPKDNQNWGLRLREMNGQACISFLFATPPEEGSSSGGSIWHRWTTLKGFVPGAAWHHIAVSYRFGKPESIHAVIDGHHLTGKWDMGGATTAAPVVDNDDIWIGSALGGSPPNSLRGSLDDIAIYREQVPLQTLQARYRGPSQSLAPSPQPEVVPELGNLPANRVLVTFHEGMPVHDRWLLEGETLPPEMLRWETGAVLMDRLPQRFDDWGIRESWKAPVLVRFATDVRLPPGKHRFLMRTRGLSRLWIDGTIVARSGQVKGSPSGEEPITPITPPPHPGLRSAEHRQQENIADVVVGENGQCRVILETLVGGKAFRADPGETCLAVQTDGGNSFVLLQPSFELPIELTDQAVRSALTLLELELSEFDDKRRRDAAASQNPFWEMRHQAAKEWVMQNPAPSPISENPHPLDAFLDDKVQQALTASSATPIEEARQFHGDVLPILRDHCFRCHGEQENGGLRLTSREGALKGGDSEVPAIVPGKTTDGEFLDRIRSTDPDLRMPPGPIGLSPKQISLLENWIQEGAHWPAPPVTQADVIPPDSIGDAAFIRRVYLDTIGQNPPEYEVRRFLDDPSQDKREQLIDRMLADERWADRWLGYWQDVLAENPTLINASLNTTGPFRWFLHDALRDNKPMDRLVTELILMRGSIHEGGSAGFRLASNNDAPFAAKGQILASAFLGMELQCARCHDSPYHSTTQRDLYALAAMLEKKKITVPESSRVPVEFFEKKQRESLIQVTLKPDEAVEPIWPFAEVTGCADDAAIAKLILNPDNTQERLAALITAPQNTRFSQVIVNRMWRQLLGAGLVEPPDDWEGHAPSHPELLDWLSQEFVRNNYDLKSLARLIMTSQVYQREAAGQNLTALPEVRFFISPDRRRLSAEQLVDTLHQASGQFIDAEELTFDPDARRPASNRLTLGVPQRAWMFANLANERDRPSLNLPKARALTDILEAFGWSGARQNPRTTRELSPNVLQPGVLANSTAIQLLTRASAGNGLAEIAVDAPSPEQLVDTIFLRYLSRFPDDKEKAVLIPALSQGFENRLVPKGEQVPPQPLQPLPAVTWSNHLRNESNSILLEMEQRARTGPPADPRLRPEWRQVYEDAVWSVVNIGEFIWVP